MRIISHAHQCGYNCSTGEVVYYYSYFSLSDSNYTAPNTCQSQKYLYIGCFLHAMPFQITI